MRPRFASLAAAGFFASLRMTGLLVTRERHIEIDDLLMVTVVFGADPA